MSPRPILLCLLLSASCASGPPRPDAPSPPAFIHGDLAKAFRDAEVTGKPLFVDTWAPWCHSCLALQADVLSDPALGRFSDHFVWLSLDVERAEAAPFLERFPQPAYPTLWILRPDGTPILRWVGTLTVAQLSDLLTDALVVHSGAPAAPASANRLAAEAAASEGRLDDAIAAYRAALGQATDDWARRTPTANALGFLLHKAKRSAACLANAVSEAPRAPRDAAGLPDLVIGGIGCATALSAEEPTRRAGLEVLVPLAESLAGEDQLLNDDRSGLWMAVVDGHEALGDEAAKHRASLAWAAFLDAVAAAAATPRERVVYDSHRMVAYLAVGRGADALAALGRSEKDFPNDYNPPARRAYVLRELGRYDEALAAIERALSLVYGPRRLRVRMTEASIHQKMEDPAAARRALELALTEGEALPRTQRPARVLEAIRKQIAKLPPI